MLKFIQENIFDIDAEALVNTVNCVGVMGKGLALHFKERFPENYRMYRKACKEGYVKPGCIFVYETGLYSSPKYILNFPTKRNWRDNSQIEDIQSGLDHLIKIIKKLKITSIAIPPLGCGNGKLLWSDVCPLIITAFKEVNDISVSIIEPFQQPLLYRPRELSCNPNSPKLTADGITYQTLQSPKMTRARALFIKLMERYKENRYLLSLIEIQKLAYFLQESGEPLRLKFEKGHYGPFANNLNKVLGAINGHYIRGFDAHHPKATAEIELIKEIVPQAHDFLKNDEEALARLKSVESLIDGFESPYGLELLATLHWIVHYNYPRARNLSESIEYIHQWNTHKKKFTPDHISISWDHLKELKWI